MPLEKVLTDHKNGQLDALHAQGINPTAIYAERTKKDIKRSIIVVYTYLYNQKLYGNQKDEEEIGL